MAFDHIWLRYSPEDIRTEKKQCEDEGKDISSLKAQFAELENGDFKDPEYQARAARLLDQTAGAPQRPDYEYVEPSDLESIRAQRKDRPDLKGSIPTGDELYRNLHGAWLGRVCGCLLGKPVEGARSHQIRNGLKRTGEYPLSDYFSFEAFVERYSPEDREKHRKWFAEQGPRGYGNKCLRETIVAMPEDDDTNYTTVGLAILERHGADFTPVDVANFWLREIPILHVCTAERVAYKNLVNLIPPPRSASLRNPYREWIGAQIRADFWGYACPGNPERAAEFAWRDACISHVKNGIYGEMFVAAMLAAAAASDDLDTVIDAGLGEIPSKSRLHEAIQKVRAWKGSGVSYDEAVEKVWTEWDENQAHDWCHTISNAMLVVVALLWGENDYGKTICRAVQPGFDTDCNGATAGSVFGMMHGDDSIPEKWWKPVNDTLSTGVTGFHTVKISEMARRSVEVIEKMRSNS
jgi:ADP-ribosylglycohydrolase